jgi:hypothetical protein
MSISSLFQPAPKYIHQIKIAPAKQVDIVKKGAPTPAGPCCTVGSVADEITTAVENIANAGGMGKHVPVLTANDGKFHIMIDGGLSSNPGMGAVTGFSIFAAVATLKASIETIREQNSRIDNAKKVLEDIQIHQECRKELGVFLKDKQVIKDDGNLDFGKLFDSSFTNSLTEKIQKTPYSTIEKTKNLYIKNKLLKKLKEWSEKEFSEKTEIRKDFISVAVKTISDIVGLKANELAELYGKSKQDIEKYIKNGIEKYNPTHSNNPISEKERENYTNFITKTFSQKPRNISIEDWKKTLKDFFSDTKNGKNNTDTPQKKIIKEDETEQKISKESPSKIRLGIRKEKWMDEHFYQPLTALLEKKQSATDEEKETIKNFLKEPIESTKNTGIHETPEEKSLKKFLKDGIIESRGEKIIPGYLASTGISLIALGRFVPLATPVGQFIMSAYAAGNVKMSYRDFKYAKSKHKLAKRFLEDTIEQDTNPQQRIPLNEAKKHYGSMKKWAAVSTVAWALNTAGMLAMGTFNSIKWAAALAAAPITAGLSISAAALTDTVSSLMTEGMFAATAAVAAAALVCVPSNLKLRSRNFMSLKPPKSWEKEKKDYVSNPFNKAQLEEKIVQNKELRDQTKTYRKEFLNSIEVRGSKTLAKVVTKAESTLNNIMMWGGLGLFSNYVMKRKFKAKQRVSSLFPIKKIEEQVKQLNAINRIAFNKDIPEKTIGMGNFEQIFTGDEIDLMYEINIEKFIKQGEETTLENSENTNSQTTEENSVTASAFLSNDPAVKKEDAKKFLDAIKKSKIQTDNTETLKRIIQKIEEHFGISEINPKTPEGYLSTIKNHAKVGDISKILSKIISETKNGKTRLRNNFIKQFGTQFKDKDFLEKLEELNQFGPCCDTTSQGKELLNHLQSMFSNEGHQKALQKLLFNATNQYLVYQLNRELKEEKATWLDLYMNTLRNLGQEKPLSEGTTNTTVF